jgi:hypothetical protein
MTVGIYLGSAYMIEPAFDRIIAWLKWLVAMV